MIKERKREATNYKAYLKSLVELAKKAARPALQTYYPPAITSPPRRALYDNLGQDEALAVELDTAIRAKKRDDWRGNRFKEKEVRIAIEEILRGRTSLSVDQIYEIVKAQPGY